MTATTASDDLDWSGVSLEMAQQIHAQGQTYLAAQLQAALASDQRAVTMSSILAATAVAILGAGIGFWENVGDASILVAVTAAALTLLLGACFGAWAARPVAFWYPGNDPAHWYDCRHGSLAEAVGGEAENYSERIGYNAAILEGNQTATALGMAAAILAPVVGFVAWMLAAIS